MEDFRYLGTTITNENQIQEEIERRLNSGNACYHSVQNILPSGLLSKNITIRIYEGESESKDNFEVTTSVSLLENKCTRYFST
jgi:hypothetical protein